MRLGRGAFAGGLAARVFIGAAGLVLVVQLVAGALLARSSRSAGEETLRRSLEQSADLVAQFLAGRQRSLIGGARVFVQGPYFRAIVAERRRDDILDQAFEAAAQLDADWVFVVDEQGMLLAKSDEPGAFGTDLGSVPLVRGALRGQVTTGFGVSRDSLLFHAVAVPIAVKGGAPMGALIATKIVDAALARDVKAVAASDIVFFVRDTSNTSRTAASTLSPVVAARLLSAPQIRVGGTGSHETARTELGGLTYALQGGRLTTAGGDPVGGYVVLRRAEVPDNSFAASRNALLVSACVGVLLAFLATLATLRRVSDPLAALAAAVRHARDADHRGSEHAAIALSRIAGTRAREIGNLGAELRSLFDELGERQALAALVFPIEAAPVSDDAADAAGPSGGRTFASRQSVAAAERRRRPSRAIAPADEVVPGAVLASRYVIEARLGESPSGIVYRAVDRADGMPRAIKLLAADTADPTALPLEELRSTLDPLHSTPHRNVVRIHDVGILGPHIFLAMEYVDGVSLATLLRHRPSLTEDALLSIAKQLCRSMQAAHARNVTHGALSARHVLIRRDGMLKVGGYGIASLRRRVIATPLPGARWQPPRIAGATVGAPEYMPPEQLLGGAPDAMSDVYAAGVILSECMAGTTPFRTESPLAFLAHKFESVNAATVSSGQPTLHDIVARMTAPERAQRPGSAHAVLRLLTSIPVA